MRLDRSKDHTKGIVSFLLICFGITWISFAVVWFAGIRAPGSDDGLLDWAAFVFLVLPVSFGPAIANFIVRKWITLEGFADAGLKLNFKSSWRYYLLAWFYPLFVILGILILAAVTGASKPVFADRAPIVLVQYMLISVVTAPYSWGEEFGWRGYLQIRLFADRPLLAALATGLIWGIWHYPMIISGQLASSIPLAIALIKYPIEESFLSVIYGWFRYRTNSVWPPSLAHSTSNNMISNLLPLLIVKDPKLILVWVGFEFAIKVIIAVVIVLTGQFKANSAS